MPHSRTLQNPMSIMSINIFHTFGLTTLSRMMIHNFAGITKYKSESHWIYKLTDYWQYPGNRELFLPCKTYWFGYLILFATCVQSKTDSDFFVTFGKCTQNTHIATFISVANKYFTKAEGNAAVLFANTKVYTAYHINEKIIMQKRISNEMFIIPMKICDARAIDCAHYVYENDLLFIRKEQYFRKLLSVEQGRENNDESCQNYPSNIQLKYRT